jgi:hypothetical protein
MNNVEGVITFHNRIFKVLNDEKVSEVKGEKKDTRVSHALTDLSLVPSFFY